MNLRNLEAKDEQVLWLMLMHAAHENSVNNVKNNSELIRYVENWGREGDFGHICEVEKVAVGAAWLRLWAADDRGYGYVDESVPELAIAVIPEMRGQGVGTALLKNLLLLASDMFPAVSLSIRADNPALRLYERIGFVLVEGSKVTNRVGGVSFSMIHRF